MNILVIDAQGGGIGRQLVAELLRRMPSAEITAVGTNSAATAAMLKAGAHHAATGENAVVVGCRRADVIVETHRHRDRGFALGGGHAENGGRRRAEQRPARAHSHQPL